MSEGDSRIIKLVNKDKNCCLCDKKGKEKEMSIICKKCENLFCFECWEELVGCPKCDCYWRGDSKNIRNYIQHKELLIFLDKKINFKNVFILEELK